MEIRVDVDNGPDFFADEVSVSHSPIRFILDFKRTAPRIEGNEQRLLLRHDVIIIDPFFAKELLKVLKDNVGRYEKRFGEIKKPEALKKATKTAKKSSKKPSKQDYFG